MANIILPAVPILSEIDDSAKLLIEQAGEINRYPISDLDIGINIDESLSAISVNPVQNKVINDAIQKLTNNKSDTIQITNGNTIYLNNSAHTPLKGLKIFGKTTQNGTPSPDAPVPLVSAGDSGNVTTIINGKNLLNLLNSSQSVTGGGVTYTRNDDGSYTRNGTAVNEPGNAWLRGDYSVTPNSNNVIIHLLPGESYYIRDCILFSCYNNTPVGYSGNFYINPLNYPDGFKVTGVRNPTHAIDKTYNDIIYPAVFLGSSDNINTDYEPYIESTTTISTPNGLPGIPVTSGGNYTDSTGQQWICDYIDFANGKYVQMVHKQILTQNDSYVMQQENIVRGYTNAKSVPGGAIISTHLKSGPYGGIGSINVGYSGKQIYFSLFATIDDFKAILGDAGMTVYYELAEPIETDLTEEQLTAYAALHTNYPNTTIYNDAGADMEVKYYTPNTAVQMVHSPVDEGKVLAIDEHGCVVLSDDIGGGTISIDFEGVNEGEATPINADTLGGYTAQKYVKRDELNDYGLVEKNYSVIGNPNEPENPTENMIWVQTEDDITEYVFSRKEPIAMDGLVWIYTGAVSNVGFASMKFDNIYMHDVYPISAKQYIGGAWVDKTAKIWQGGAWVDWWDGTLYYASNAYEEITGGWTNSGYTFNGIACGSVVNKDGKLTFNSTSGSTYPGGGTALKVDISDYNIIRFIGYSNTSAESPRVGVYSGKNLSSAVAHALLEGGSFEKTVDISNLKDSYYIGGMVYGYITKVVLEV